jgi:multicomponent K+:H+ antiporter subunit C
MRAFAVIVRARAAVLCGERVHLRLGPAGGERAPILDKYGDGIYTDPLPQALVLTAIVISFGMTAVLVMIALGSYLESGDDRIDLDGPRTDAEDGAQ